MNSITETPGRAIMAGLALTAVVILLWLAAGGLRAASAEGAGLATGLVHFAHVMAAIIWIGLVWYVNLVQLGAVAEADDAGKQVIHRLIAPKVAASFRHASTLTVITGAILTLASTDLTFDRMPSAKALLLVVGLALGTLMWGFVHMVIWPNMRIVLGLDPGDDAGRAVARANVKTYARINLLLAFPVTFAMVGAAHLA